MDLNNLRGLMEAFEQVHAPQEVDEAVKGEPSERRKDLAAERRAGHRPLPAKEGEKYASHKLSQIAYVKRKRMGEELDIFDVVLEFLQAEGFAETLEEAEWMMANMIDEEAIDIILGEEQLDEVSLKTKMSAFKKRATDEFESDGDNPKNYTKSGKSKADQTKANIVKKHGKKAGEHAERAAHAGIFGRKSFSMPKKPTNEEFEAWLDEAMSSYDRNRKRAAQRAAARNAARDAGKTGAVPGVGYVTPRRERETYVDSAGTTRHKSGAKMPKD